MNTSAIPAELRATAPALSAGVATILRNLIALMARLFLRDPRHVGLTLKLHRRLTRAIQALDGVMARLAAGTLRAARSRPGRPSSGRPPLALPRGRGWLAQALGHDGRGMASQLHHLLARPEAAALLAATPQARRLLRPICHMLGIAPVALQLPRPTSPPPAFAGGGRGEGRAAAQTRAAPRTPRTGPPEPEPPLLPVRELCPRLLTRWPFVPHPKARPA